VQLTSRAVVLARGLGTRMREADSSVSLTPDQQRSADAGLKPMIPVNGRPFLEYVLGAIADAGIHRVALIVAPDHDIIRRHFDNHPPSRLAVDFVVQAEALGTADAVLAAERWAGGEPFLAMNADNLYPPRALRELAALDEPGLPAFDADDLVRTGNIPAERVKAFALVETDDDGYLVRIVEKPRELPPDKELPSDKELPPEGGSYQTGGGRYQTTRESETQHPQNHLASAFRRKNLLVSMNCWRFDSRIFDACRDVPRSARGEFELPEAVALAMTRGVRFRAMRASGPVLDLSRRADMIDLARRLETAAPRP
jgi:glucose-1-phosphate thymidylyltransferase